MVPGNDRMPLSAPCSMASRMIRACSGVPWRMAMRSAAGSATFGQVVADVLPAQFGAEAL